MPDAQRPGGPEERATREDTEGALDLEEPLPEEAVEDIAALEPGGETATVAAVATAAAGGVAVERPGSLWGDAWRELRRNPLFIVPAVLIAVLIVMAAWPGLFTDADPRSCDINDTVLRPSSEHWFGTDVQGCDYFSKVIYGARVSVLVGILSAGTSAVVAVIFGMLAGYYGAAADAIIARITDIWLGMPAILAGIVFLTVFRARGVGQIVLVLAVVLWPTMLRLMRGSVLSAKSHDYVMAARGLGAGDLRIMTRHILPNAVAPVIVYATIVVGVAIGAEATLSFIGVGLQLPAISWGLMVSDAQTRILQAPHLLLFPGLFLSTAVFSFVLLGDALRDAFDPRLR